MGIYLGDLLPERIQKRLNITLSDEHLEMLKNSHQAKVNDTELAYGKWHCFDIPFMFMCSDKKTAEKWRDIFMSYDLSNAEQFQIAWEKEYSKISMSIIDDIKADIDEQSEIHADGEFYIKNIDVKRIINKHIAEAAG